MTSAKESLRTPSTLFARTAWHTEVALIGLQESHFMMSKTQSPFTFPLRSVLHAFSTFWITFTMQPNGQQYVKIRYYFPNIVRIYFFSLLVNTLRHSFLITLVTHTPSGTNWKVTFPIRFPNNILTKQIGVINTKWDLN